MLNELEKLSKEWYAQNYNLINVTAQSRSFFSSYMHKKMEVDIPSNANWKILEVGGNRGEHLKYVKKPFGKYILSDVIEPKLLDKSFLKDKKIICRIEYIHKLSFRSNSFNRVIVTCLFHHLIDPYVAAKEILRVTKSHGIITILLPCDPGILYRTLRYFTSVRNAKNVGLHRDLELIHAIEHRNHYLSLLKILNFVFAKHQIRIKMYPVRIPFYNLNAFAVIHIKKT